MNVVIRTVPPHPTLKTPQELIHVQHKISLRQYKYWILMLRAYREAYDSGKLVNEDGYCVLPLTTVTARMGYRPSNAELRGDLEAIRKEPIIYNALRKDGTPVIRGAGFISTWQVASGYIGFTLPDMLCRCVERLDDRDSIFHLLNWSVFSTFAGKHEANLYKLCKDYVGVRRTPVLTVSSFREYMGISDHEYPEFKALNRYVVADSVQRINESAASDITVEAVYAREFRKVVSLQFLVQPKQQLTLSWGDEPAFAAARSLISVVQQREYLTARSADAIRASIDRANIYIDEQTKQAKPVRNAGGIYRKAIVEDWGSQRSTNQDQLQESALAQVAATLQRTNFVGVEREKEEEVRASVEALWQRFLGLPELQRAELVELAVGDKKLLRRQLNDVGLESIIVRNAIMQHPLFQKLVVRQQ
ncbi:MAG: replication initiation protein [Rhizobacter sp.]|nr:replication initiation protein [Burkholderiales bacterium]